MATVTTCVGVASMLTAIGRAMSWFARPLWMYALYVSQVVCVPIVCLLAASTKQRKVCILKDN